MRQDNDSKNGHFLKVKMLLDTMQIRIRRETTIILVLGRASGPQNGPRSDLARG